MMRPSSQVRRNAALVALLAPIALVATASCKLDSLVFSSDTVSEYRLTSTVIADSLRKQVTFSSGGDRLYGYWLRQPGNAPRLTLIYSHGKGTNLSSETPWEHAEALWSAGFDVLTYDYRGFGMSGGTSDDETTLAADAQAALAFALTQPGVTLSRVVSFGHSIGSAPAIALAAGNPGLRALIVESGFSNGQAMAESAVPLGIPVTWLMRQPMVNTEKMARTQMPVLVIHGERDLLIPYEQGVALYNAAPGSKQLRLVPGAGHTDVPATMGTTAYAALLRNFVSFAR